MSKKKKQNKKIRDKYSITQKELEDQGRVPKYFHLYDHVEMEEYQKQHQTDWWRRMSNP